MKAKDESGEDCFSIHALAFKLRIERNTLKKYLADVPPRKMAGKIPLYRISDAQAVKDAVSENRTGTFRQLREESLQETIRSKRIKNDRELGRMTPNSVFIAKINEYVGQAKQLLRQKFETEIPSQVARLDPANARVICQRAVDEVCLALGKLCEGWEI